MNIADQSTRKASWHITHDQAVRTAKELTDKWGLPSTIYLSDTGFCSYEATSPHYRNASVTVTILPSNWFH